MTTGRILPLSMTRTALPTLALLGLTLALLPAALAQAEDPARPDDAAWVEDCPPDMMCAASANETAGEEPTHGDCGAEVCAYDSPGALGPSDCIECMQPPVDAEAEAAEAAPRNTVPGASLAAAVGILGVAALAVAMLTGGRR